MAAYSPAEIALMTGKKRSSIETYVTRGKLIKNLDKKIDEDNPVNALFLSKHTSKYTKPQEKQEPKTAKEIVNASPPTQPKKEAQEEQQNPRPQPSPEQKKTQETASALIQLEYATKKLNAKKIQKEVELKEIEIAKKKGELVDLQGVGSVISQYVSTTNRNLLESLETLVRSICSRHGIEPSKCGKYLKEIKEIINTINQESVEEVFKNLENIS